MPAPAVQATRHELKYYINQGDAMALIVLLDRIMRRDPNADEWGDYAVRSLYFDDARNTAYYDKMSGVRDRDKYRIRIYNYSAETILLERKTKIGDGIAKTAVPIDRELAEQLIACDPTGLERHHAPLVREMYRLMRTRMLAPAVLVDYVRQAYTFPAENLRITFDKHLHTGFISRDLFNPGAPMLPVADVGTILEVKYDRIMPDLVRSMLSVAQPMRSAVSKYTLCRAYEPLR